MAKPLTCLYCSCIPSTWIIYTNSIPYTSSCTISSGVRSGDVGYCGEEIAQRLEQLVNEVVNEQNWQVLTLSIQPDHVHLFIRSNPYTEPSDIARLIKGRSSHALREEFPYLMKMPSLWTRSTFYSTAGNVSSETIQKYIERQSKH